MNRNSAAYFVELLPAMARCINTFVDAALHYVMLRLLLSGVDRLHTCIYNYRYSQRI